METNEWEAKNKTLKVFSKEWDMWEQSKNEWFSYRNFAVNESEQIDFDSKS